MGLAGAALHGSRKWLAGVSECSCRGGSGEVSGLLIGFLGFLFSATGRLFDRSDFILPIRYLFSTLHTQANEHDNTDNTNNLIFPYSITHYILVGERVGREMEEKVPYTRFSTSF